MKYSLRSLVLLSILVIIGSGTACASRNALVTNPEPTAKSRSHLVVEDKEGKILAVASLQGHVADYTVRKTDGDLEVVTSIRAEYRDSIDVMLQSMLREHGLRPVSLRRALRRGQITCHVIFGGPGVPVAGIGLTRCDDALLYRAKRSRPPVLMGSGEDKYAGMTAEAIAAEPGDEPVQQCTNTSPRQEEWARLLPFLRAQVILEIGPNGQKTFFMCGKKNNLALIPADQRDSDLEVAARRALISLKNSSQENQEYMQQLLLEYAKEPANFPDNFLADPWTQAALEPFLSEHLGKCAITLASLAETPAL